MTRTKATELLGLAISDPDLVNANDLVEAQKLGSEALKWVGENRYRLYPGPIPPLPGEDPE